MNARPPRPHLEALAKEHALTRVQADLLEEMFLDDPVGNMQPAFELVQEARRRLAVVTTSGDFADIDQAAALLAQARTSWRAAFIAQAPVEIDA